MKLLLLLAALASQQVDIHSRPLREEREHDFDILHYRIELSLEEENRSLRGETTIRMAALRDRLTTCTLDAETFTVDRVLDGASQALPFTHRDGRLTIELDRPVAHGDEISVTVHYSGHERRCRSEAVRHVPGLRPRTGLQERVGRQPPAHQYVVFPGGSSSLVPKLRPPE